MVEAGTSVPVSQESNATDNAVEKYVYDPRLREVLARRGVTSLMPVQVEAIRRGLFYRQSFLACAPSGSGKTLVGEMAAAMAVLNRLGKAAYLVPYRALAAQKASEFARAYEPYGVKVVLAMGDDDVPEQTLAAADILVTTFEKLDAALRNAKTQAWIKQLAVVIVDEIHEMGEPDRGPRLESLLVRLFQRIAHVQVIGLSATIGHPQELAAWLGTLGTPVQLIYSETRPVPLSYEITIDGRKDKFILQETRKVLDDGGQVLVFVATRKEAEQQAGKLANLCAGYLEGQDKDQIKAQHDRLEKVRGRNPTLGECLQSGVGFHHAGLDKQERKAVEKLYDRRAVKVVCCTTTLAAGINTPARVVILRGVEMKKAPKRAIQKAGMPGLPAPWLEHFSNMYAFIPFPPNQVFQLLGRAGRPGYDTIGRGIVLVSSDTQAAWARDFYFTRAKATDGNATGSPGETLVPKYAPLLSQLNAPDALREQVLVRIHEAGRVTLADLRAFLDKTLFAFQWRRTAGARGKGVAIDSFLRVTKPSLADIAALHVPRIASRMTIPLQVQRWGVDGHRVSAEVVSPTSAVHCYFDALAGPSCSCNARDGKELGENPPQLEVHLCPHLGALLRMLVALPPAQTTIPADIIVRSLKEDNVLSFLITRGFIRSVPGAPPALEATGFGSLTASLYVPPSQALLVRNAIHGDAPVTVENLFRLGSDLMNEREETKAATVGMLEAWVEELPPEEVVTRAGKSLGDLGAATANVSRSLEIAASFADFFAIPSAAHEARVLAIRVRHGVKEDLIDLAARVPGVGRVRARSLVNAGYSTPTDIASTEVGILVQRTGISLKVMAEIHAQCKTILKNLNEVNIP